MRLALLISQLALAAFTPQAQALEVSSARIAECRANLVKRLCYSEPVDHWLEDQANLKAGLARYQDRKCLATPPARMRTLLDVYDRFPAPVQAAFCAMRRIYLVKGDVNYGARTEYFFDEAKTTFGETEWGTPTMKAVAAGFVLEISEMSRFSGESAGAYMTRVTQKRFGHDVAKGVSPDLPVVEYTTPFGSDGALATTILHEIGHMVHRAAKATRAAVYRPFAATPWTLSTWTIDEESYSIKNANDINLWEKMRDRQLQIVDVPASIALMKKNGFPSYYASSAPDEEFSEWYMFHFYDDVKVKLKGQVALDLRAEFAKNPAFAKKKAMIKALVDSPELYSLKTSFLIEGRF